MLLNKLSLLLTAKLHHVYFNPLKSAPNECNRIYRTPHKNATLYGIQTVSITIKQLYSQGVPFYLYHPIYKIKDMYNVLNCVHKIFKLAHKTCYVMCVNLSNSHI
jgi:hypothetical protein